MMRPILSSQRGRRRLTVAATGALYLSALGALVVSVHLDLYWLKQAGLISIVATYGTLMLLGLWTGHVTTRPDHEIDERQRAVRDRAYRLAYFLLGAIIAAFYGYLMIGQMAGFWIPREPSEFISAFLLVFATLFTGLPAAVLAWIEPEPPAE